MIECRQSDRLIIFHNKYIFNTNTKTTRIHTRLQRENHIFLKRILRRRRQTRKLMNLTTDTMTQSMNEILTQNSSNTIMHSSTRNIHIITRQFLGSNNPIISIQIILRRNTKKKRPRHIRTITINNNTHVNNNKTTQLRRRSNMMRRSSISTSGNNRRKRLNNASIIHYTTSKTSKIKLRMSMRSKRNNLIHDSITNTSRLFQTSNLFTSFNSTQLTQPRTNINKLTF